LIVRHADNYLAFRAAISCGSRPKGERTKAASVLALPEQPGALAHVENEVAGSYVLLRFQLSCGSSLALARIKCCSAASSAMHKRADYCLQAEREIVNQSMGGEEDPLAGIDQETAQVPR
jgi:hypothetical protein